MLRISLLVFVFVFALNQVGSDVPHKTLDTSLYWYSAIEKNLSFPECFWPVSVPYGQNKILITVYYESKCPDSREFIIEQLQPTINLLHNYLTLRLVPFGKARSVNKAYNGFQCQHGHSECAGNLVQSCTLDLMQGRNDVEKVSYVACEMQTEAGTRGDMQCALGAGVPVNEVKKCVNSERGIALQLEDEYLTKLVRPKFIPTITIDGVFNQQVQDSSLEDFTGTLCSVLTNIPPCQQHYNSMAMRYVLL